MGRTSIKINLGDSYMSENWKRPYPWDERTERRLKRRVVMNVSLKQNCFASATKTTVKICQNMNVLTDKDNHMIDEDEDDEDYKTFLDTYFSDIDSASDNNGISDIDVDTGYNSGNDEIDEDYISFLDTHVFDIDSANDEMDEDYKSFLDTYVPDIDSACDDNVGGFNIDVNNGYNSINDDDYDPDYSWFLRNQLDHIQYEGEEGEEEERFHKKLKLDTKMSKVLNVDYDGVDKDYQLFLNSGWIDWDSFGNMDSGLIGKSSNVRQNSQVSDQAFDTPEGQCGFDEDYQVFLNSASNLVYMCDKNTTKISKVEDGSKTSKAFDTREVQYDIDEDYQVFLNSAGNLGSMPDKNTAKTSKVEDGSKTSKAFDTRKVQYDIGEDYQVFLNSAGNLGSMPDKNTIKISKVEDGSDSSDSDVILMERNPICENSPFVSSKTYDSSCFEKERNPGDDRQLSADDHPQFRRRLMEYLERPYDQQEYVAFLQEVYQRKQNVRHFETRQGVVKLYHTKGVNNSYLELYTDLEKAIAEFKEPRRVLFLLRGFFFWLQNLCHDGIFRPWLDESCLETCRKL